MIADVCAEFIWAAWHCLLGRVGGAIFEGTWAAILASAGMGAVLALVIEGVNRLRRRTT